MTNQIKSRQFAGELEFFGDFAVRQLGAFSYQVFEKAGALADGRTLFRMNALDARGEAFTAEAAGAKVWAEARANGEAFIESISFGGNTSMSWDSPTRGCAAMALPRLVGMTINGRRVSDGDLIALVDLLTWIELNEQARCEP